MSSTAAPTTLSLCAALSNNVVNGCHAAGAAAAAGLCWARAAGATTATAATAAITRRNAFDRHRGIAERHAYESEGFTLL